jgi:hypothetical protein
MPGDREFLILEAVEAIASGSIFFNAWETGSNRVGKAVFHNAKQ